MSEAVADILFLCRCLSVDDSPAAVSALREEICAGDIDWRQIAKLAADHFLTPALWVSLSQKGLETLLPEDARDFLQYVYGLNVERNEALRAEVLRIAASLNEVGVEPILLKGAIHLFDSAYRDPSARMMVDIDVLVPEAEIAHGLAALAKLGYHPAGEAAWKAHTYSPLCRPGATWSLDLHRYLGYQRNIVASMDVQRESVALETDGVRLRAPSPTQRVFHNLYHAQLQNRQHALGLIALMQLCDFAALGRHHSGAIDWAWLRASARHHGIRHALEAYVHLAVELCGLARPCELPESFKARLHLRRCLGQLRYPACLTMVRRWDALTYSFISGHIQTYYNCGNNWFVINFFRFRMLYCILRKNGWQLTRRMGELWRFGSPGQPR
jgi:putative nucleotidyltransferase-like protein